MYLPRSLQRIVKEDTRRQKMLLKKQQQALQKVLVERDRSLGLSETEVQFRKAERQTEYRARRPGMIQKMDQAACGRLREVPEQIELDELAAEHNLLQG